MLTCIWLGDEGVDRGQRRVRRDVLRVADHAPEFVPEQSLKEESRKRTRSCCAECTRRRRCARTADTSAQSELHLKAQFFIFQIENSKN